MKFYLLIFFFVSVIFSAPIKREIAVTDTYVEIRKNLLECIIETERTSPSMKKYAEDFLKTDLKGDLNLGQFRENPVDYDVIKKCRRQAFFNKKIGK